MSTIPQHRGFLRKENLFSGLEIFLVLIVFYLFGAWPVPDSNEPYYVGKAIHFWNPDWIPNDPFLESKDSHWTFYVAFGWTTFFLSPYSMAWAGRLLTWGLLAWSWRRLSFSLIPIRWMSIPTGLALAYYVDSFHLAGEWILGGVEGKSFAFPFVFFGLEAMVRGRWNRVWIFLGIASAFHVLVGGWSVLVAGMVWLTTVFSQDRFSTQNSIFQKAFWSLAPGGLLLGGLISLFGLAPALLLDYGAPKEIVREAHQIYVFERLYHHLVPYMLPWTFTGRFVLLVAVWFFLCRHVPGNGLRHRRFNAFVFGSLILSGIGFLVAYSLKDNKPLAAEILRFYWFRLADIAVPMGIAVGSLRQILHGLQTLKKKQEFNLASDRRCIPLLFLKLFSMLGVLFAVYLFWDSLVFGKLFFSWNIAPDTGIPWLLAILSGWFILKCFQRRSEVLCVENGTADGSEIAQLRAGRPETEWFFHLGLILLYSSLLFYAPFAKLTELGDLRTRFSYARTESGYPTIAYHWIDICRWCSDNTPKTARFWVPKEGSTFKWHANRSDVGVWKNVPQDAVGIVAWNRTMKELFFYEQDGQLRQDRSLTILLWWKSPEELESLRQKYGFDHIVCGREPLLEHQPMLKPLYENEFFAVYHVSPLAEKR